MEASELLLGGQAEPPMGPPTVRFASFSFGRPAELAAVPPHRASSLAAAEAVAMALEQETDITGRRLQDLPESIALSTAFP